MQKRRHAHMLTLDTGPEGASVWSVRMPCWEQASALRSRAGRRRASPVYAVPALVQVSAATQQTSGIWRQHPPCNELARRFCCDSVPLLCRCMIAQAEAPAPGGVLLCGPRGSGKSSVLSAIATVLGSNPACLAACSWLDCRSLAGEGLAAWQRQILTKVCISPVNLRLLNFSAPP